jgi:hypothetical protein
MLGIIDLIDYVDYLEEEKHEARARVATHRRRRVRIIAEEVRTSLC